MTIPIRRWLIAILICFSAGCAGSPGRMNQQSYNHDDGYEEALNETGKPHDNPIVVTHVCLIDPIAA